MKNLDKNLLSNVIAIIPIYKKDYGNASIVIDNENNEHIIKMKVKSVLHNIAKFYHIDLIECRKKYASIINKSNHLPIPINENMTLIPLKMRKPLIENDGSLGYVRYEAIDSIAASDVKNSIVTLKGGKNIKCLVNYRTVCKNLKDTRIVKEEYLTAIKGNLCENTEDYCSKSDKSSIRTDIALVLLEIKKVTDLIKGTGGRGQGTGDRGQGTGDRGQGTGDRRQGTGDRGQGTGDRGQLDRGQGTGKAWGLFRNGSKLEGQSLRFTKNM